jgi:glycosyltransferase involved in cell wall biosynthesis
VPLVSSAVFYPMKKRAEFIYESADKILAVSKEYVSRALAVNRICSAAESVYLGTELKFFDAAVKENSPYKNENEIWLVYIGTLGHSYHITCVLDALVLVKAAGIKNMKFIIIGHGPLRETFEAYAHEKKVDCEFKGMLDYPQMATILSKCDIAVNPIRSGSSGSIINKVGDYAAAGLPVVNTQECAEYRNLVEEYQIGMNCENKAEDIAEKILTLCRDQELRRTLGKNNRRLAEEKFDREKTYEKILELIEA